MPLEGFCCGSFGAFNSIGRSAGIPPWTGPDARLSWPAVASKVLKEKFIAEQHSVEFHMISDPGGTTAALKLDGVIISSSGPHADRNVAQLALDEMIHLQDDIIDATL